MRATVPHLLTTYDQWIFWKVKSTPNGPTKVPCTMAGVPVSVKDPDSWHSFEYALGMLEELPALAGIGFCFTIHDPFFGIDIDGCLPSISAQAREIIASFPTWADLSPSNTGIKMFGLGSKGDITECATTNVEGFKKLEVYDQDRFFTVTGRQYGVECGINDCQEALVSLMTRFFPPKVHRGTQNVIEGASSLLDRASGFGGTDDELVEYLREDPKYDRLWLGDSGDYRNDDSVADEALAEKIAWLVGPFPSRIERIFSASAAGNRKNRKWLDREDYRQRTINFALSGKTDFYSGNGRPKDEPAQQVDLAKPYNIVDLNTVESQRITWHVKDFVPKGMAVLLASAGGVIKGLYTMWLAANHIEGTVLYLGSEDNLASIIKPRAEAAGVDLDRFKPLRTINLVDGTEVPIRFPIHAEWLELAIKDTDAKLVVIDAGPEHLQEGLKNNGVEDIRRFMGPLNDIAERLNVTILVIQHTNKTQGAAGTDRIGGSRAWVDAQRHVNTAAMDDEEDDVRHVQVTKSNIGKKDIGRKFRVKMKMVAVRDRDTGEWVEEDTPYIVDEGMSTKDVETLLSAKKEQKDPTVDKEILDYLNGGTGGKRDSTDVDKAVEMKTGNKERTVRNHRIALSKRGLVQNFQDNDQLTGKTTKWQCRLTSSGYEYLQNLKADERFDDEWEEHEQP